MSDPTTIIVNEEKYFVKIFQPERPSRIITIQDEGNVATINVDKVFAQIDQQIVQTVVHSEVQNITVTYGLVGSGGGGTPEVSYTSRFDGIDLDTFYFGEALPGAAEGDSVWRIRKGINRQSNLNVLWAGGASTFVNKWDDRALLSYN